MIGLVEKDSLKMHCSRQTPLNQLPADLKVVGFCQLNESELTYAIVFVVLIASGHFRWFAS